MLTPVIGTAPLNQKPSGEIDITFFSQVRPTGVAGLPGVKVQTTLSRYEAHVTIGGGLDGRFRGSIYPDNMNVKGRLRDGTYDVYLGFHKPKTPTQHDLVVRTNGFRPVLVLNRGNTLPVISNVASKRTADGIHIHNGYNHWTSSHPMSEGCLLVHPNDWTAFISKFLHAFPKLSDWSTNGSRVGRRIGTVRVICAVYNDLPGTNVTGAMYA